jgi:hypothetical protein
LLGVSSLSLIVFADSLQTHFFSKKKKIISPISFPSISPFWKTKQPSFFVHPNSAKFKIQNQNPSSQIKTISGSSPPPAI